MNELVVLVGCLGVGIFFGIGLLIKQSGIKAGDIYDEVTAKEITPRKLDSECLGGGRIQFDSQNKKIKIYGYSQGFGKADHSVSADLVKKAYADYFISWSDEGY